jgi:hypothetical protein
MRENNMFSLSAKVLVRLHVAIITALLATGFGFPAGTAETSSDSKRTAFETIDKNAEQIATVGDVLYYFGEPGMQEHESSKYLKETLEGAGFKVELGGAGMGDVGFRKSRDRDGDRNGRSARGLANSR